MYVKGHHHEQLFFTENNLGEWAFLLPLQCLFVSSEAQIENSCD